VLWHTARASIEKGAAMTALAIRPVARIDGAQILEATLSTARAQVRILSWGAVLRDWRVPDGSEGGAPMTLGLARVEDHPAHSPAFGALCGRVANRISGAAFRCGGRAIRIAPNEGANLLHGGACGTGIRAWEMSGDSQTGALRLTLALAHGEGGWPGALALSVLVTLQDARLSMDIEAIPDRETPVNLAQHSYWNLDGGRGAEAGAARGGAAGDVLGHLLRVDADAFTPVDGAMIPTGAVAPVAGGPLDFRAARGMRGADGGPLPLDVNLMLRAGRDMGAPAAEAWGASGRHLRLWTDREALQVYNAPGLSMAAPGLDGRRYGAYAGLCLEPQSCPDAVNRPEFSSIMHAPGRPYRQRWSVEIV
jgi:aldose 1-epimerase